MESDCGAGSPSNYSQLKNLKTNRLVAVQDGNQDGMGVSVISLLSNHQLSNTATDRTKNCSNNNALIQCTHPFLYSLLISVSSHNGKSSSKPLEVGFAPVVSVFVLHRRIIVVVIIIIIIIPSSPGIINHTIQIATSYRSCSGGEAGSDAGRCTVQDCSVCGPAFWGERVVGLGPTSRCKLH